MALDVLVRLRDNLSGPLRRLRNNLKGLSNFARRIGVLGVAIGALSFLGPIQEAAAFQQKLIDIAGTAELSGKAAFAFVDEAGGRYEALAFKVGQYSDTIAEGAGQMIAAGISRDLIDASIGDIGKAATAANSQFSDMALVATSMMQTLKVPASEIRDTMGALVVAGKEGAFELKDMAAHFPRLTASVAKFGIKGREAVNFLASALQIARKGTSDPASAANNLSNFLQKALAPLTKKNFKKMGVDIEAVMKDAAAKGINPIEAMLQKIGKLTGADQNNIAKYMKEAAAQGLKGEEALGHVREQLEAIGAAGKITELFQDQQVLDFLIPFMANVQEYKDIKEKVAAATGAAIDADFETQMQGINRQLLTFREIGKQAVRQVGFAFAEWLPAINSGLMAALGWMRDLDASTGGWVKTILSAGGGVLIAVAALGALGLVLPIVGAGFGALIALAGVLLSPLGIVIGLLAAGGAAIWKNWDRFGPRIARLWNRIKTGFSELGRTIVDRGRRMMTAGRELAERYGPMVAAGLRAGWRTAKSAIGQGWTSLTSYAGDFRDGFSLAIDSVGDDWREFSREFTGLAGELKGVVTDLWAVFDRAPSSGGADGGSLGRLFGDGAALAIDQARQLAADLREIASVTGELTGYLRNAPEGSWTRIISDAAVQAAKDVLNPIGTLAEHIQTIRSLLDSASDSGWQKLFPKGLKDILIRVINPLGVVADALRALREAVRGGIDWSALLPDAVVKAWDSVASAMERVSKALAAIKGSLNIENLVPGTSGNKDAAALGSKLGSLAPRPDRAPATGAAVKRPAPVSPGTEPLKALRDGLAGISLMHRPDRARAPDTPMERPAPVSPVTEPLKALRDGLADIKNIAAKIKPNPVISPREAEAASMKGLRSDPNGVQDAIVDALEASARRRSARALAAQPAQKPVKIDGNIDVRISVEGPGKVTGANSNNKNIRVGNNGRIVGRV